MESKPQTSDEHLYICTTHSCFLSTPSHTKPSRLCYYSRSGLHWRVIHMDFRENVYCLEKSHAQLRTTVICNLVNSYCSQQGSMESCKGKANGPRAGSLNFWSQGMIPESLKPPGQPAMLEEQRKKALTPDLLGLLNHIHFNSGQVNCSRSPQLTSFCPSLEVSCLYGEGGDKWDFPIVGRQALEKMQHIFAPPHNSTNDQKEIAAPIPRTVFALGTGKSCCWAEWGSCFKQ